MIQSIQKETYVEADEATTKALTYDILKGLHEKLDELKRVHYSHTLGCNDRFKHLEERKTKDSIVSSAFGILGGFLAVVAYWIKQWFSH